jgi:hypothetical protein
MGFSQANMHLTTSLFSHLQPINSGSGPLFPAVPCCTAPPALQGFCGEDDVDR